MTTKRVMLRNSYKPFAWVLIIAGILVWSLLILSV